MALYPLVAQELENPALQFAGQSQIDLDQYAELYGVQRKFAARHLRRRGIPASKEGRELYISILDLAIYKAQRKLGDTATPLVLNGRTYQEQMSARQSGKDRRQLRSLKGG